MIGLLDYDFCTTTSKRILVPNIEIMKLSSYYREENVYCRLLTLDSQELESYDKIYFFSEHNGQPPVPEQFLRAKNVIYGGTAFTKGVYVPFENDIIDFTIPRTFLYKEALNQKYNDGVKAKVISHVLDDTYYRNYAGNKKLPLPAIIPRKRVILYDKEFFYPDWRETLELINSRNPSGILRIHPVRCKTLSDYFTVRSFPKFSRDNDMILDLKVPTDEIPYMLRMYKNQFLADIVPSGNVFLALGGDQKIKTLYFKNLIYTLNLLYSFWSYGIMIKVRYEEPSPGFYDPLRELSLAIEAWTLSDCQTKSGRTINDRIQRYKRKKVVPTVESEQRDTLIKNYAGTKELFEQSFNGLKERGLWRL